MSVRRKPDPSRPKKARVTPLSQAGIVRLDRVVEARRRIQEGWYDRAEVRERLVEAVFENLQAS
jgi:hypothetical protein